MADRIDELFAMWSAARAEANLAYDHWCAAPGADAYAVYRAAEDRADAAERELAHAATVREPLSAAGGWSEWQPPGAADAFRGVVRAIAGIPFPPDEPSRPAHPPRRR